MPVILLALAKVTTLSGSLVPVTLLLSVVLRVPWPQMSQV